MSTAGRRWLALFVAAGAVAVACVSLISTTSVRAESTACPRYFCQPSPEPVKRTPKPPDHTAEATPPPVGSVQAVTAPTPTAFDDTKATPGPLTGTLVTPEAVLNVPVGAPGVTAHPQPEGGLTALLIVGGVLAAVCLGTFTFAVALK